MNRCEDIASATIAETAKRLAVEGYRIVQISCMKAGEGRLDLIYSFDRAYELSSYKVNVASGESIESVTASYPGAYLYENEIGELFGVKFEGLSVDFKGTLYDSIVHTPFNLLPPSGGLGTTQPSGTQGAGTPDNTGAEAAR